VSGLNGYEADGKTLPESFDAQAKLIWTHLRTTLASAAMEYGDLVSLRTFLADPPTTRPTCGCGSRIWAPTRCP